jgi:hypothetical protein
MFQGDRARAALAGLLVLGVCGWTQAGAGIIELGRKGHTASGSTFYAVVDGKQFTDAPHVSGDTAANILGRIRANIDADAQYTATLVVDPDPNRNAIRVLRETTGTEVHDLGIFEDDSGVIGGGVLANPPTIPGNSFTWAGVDAVAGNGTVTLSITLTGGMPSDNVVNTAGKTAAQVNAAMVATLEAMGFTVSGSGPYTITKAGDTFQRALFTHTDTGVLRTDMSMDFSCPVSAVPTLTGWGTAALVILMLGGAMILLRRRAAAGTV